MAIIESFAEYISTEIHTLTLSLLANIVQGGVITIIARSAILLQNYRARAGCGIAGTSVFALIETFRAADLACAMIGSEALAISITNIVHSEI